jgi:hypothetical protein
VNGAWALSSAAGGRGAAAVSEAAPKQFAGSEELLYEAACRTAGLRFDGALDDCEGVSVLLKALDRSPALSPSGRAFTWNVLASTASARIWAMNGWKDRPDCLQKKLTNPVVITGMARSGTTALHKLLSVDPQFQGVEHWLTDFPAPRPPRDKWDQDPRYQAIVKTLTSKQDMQPGLKTKHLEVAEEVDECILVLKQTFICNFFGECIQVPDYDEWWLAQDEGEIAYPWHKRILQLISADDDRRWLLKNPGHMWSMDALFACYPDAKVIQTHRRPDLALPSLTSLVLDMRKIAEGEGADLHALGKRDLKVWGNFVKRMMVARDKYPGAFIDVWHDDFNSRPMDVVRDLYKSLGLTLSPEVEVEMSKRIAAAPERRHGEHRYSLEMFGLTPADIDGMFGDYVARFQLDGSRRTR